MNTKIHENKKTKKPEAGCIQSANANEESSEIKKQNIR